MYYEGTIAKIRELIEKEAPGIEASYCEIESLEHMPLQYLLWMCATVQEMDTNSVDEAVRAARWMGLVFRELEIQKILDNKTVRDLVREDRKKGFDKPH